MDTSDTHSSHFNMAPDGRRMYSLLELSNSISSVIAKNYKNSYWIKAEIAKLNYYSKTGHCYPDLVEKENGKILAQMRAIIWSTDYKVINEKFLQVTKNPLDEGMTILLRGNLSFHSVYGFSLVIADIEPSFSLGEMAKEKMDTIQRLKKELMYDKNKTLSFPILPKRIAVVSVESSKGYSDFLNILSGNEKKYHFHLSLFPAILQGDKAVNSILAQLEKIRFRAKDFDAVAIIRGGGGDIGLNCYDHYALAKMIACFPLPLITGIGHSTNETVAEMVSHTNKITPTDVAYFLIRKFSDFDEAIHSIAFLISTAAREMLGQQKIGLTENTRIFKNASFSQLSHHRLMIDNLGGRIQRESILFRRRSEQLLNQLSIGLKYKPESRIKQEFFGLGNLQTRLLLSFKQNVKESHSELIGLEHRIRLLDPSNILKRGYSITYHDGKIIRDVNSIRIGDEITTNFANGMLMSSVEKIQKNSDNE